MELETNWIRWKKGDIIVRQSNDNIIQDIGIIKTKPKRDENKSIHATIEYLNYGIERDALINNLFLRRLKCNRDVI